MKTLLKKELEKTSKHLLNFLNKQVSKKGFPLENYYGESHAAAAFSLANQHTKSIPVLVDAYLKKDKTDIDTHWEFNNVALEQINPKHYPKIRSKYYPLKHNMFFVRKVTNWMLLRSLGYLRTGNIIDTLKGNLITSTVLLRQHGSVLYDNRLHRKKELSHQYHAFATSLLGEIYLETKNPVFLAFFKGSINFLKKITVSHKKFESSNAGRGRKQIFGYVAAIHALVLGSLLLKDKICMNRAKMMTEHLRKYQRKDGSFPLVLSNQEFKHKKYKDKERLLHWESYNRYYDYIGFAALYLEKTIQILKDR